MYVVAIGKIICQLGEVAHRHTVTTSRASVPSTSGHRFSKSTVSLESALQQSLDSLLRFRPRQRGLKGGDGVEEPVGGRQRDLVDEILRSGDGTPVEGGDPARECVDEAVQFARLEVPG